MYLFAIDKKIVKDRSFSNSPTNKAKQLNIHHKDNSLFRHANKAIFSMINNTEWTLNE